MNKNFDDLFNEFFEEFDKRPYDEETEKIADMISNFSDLPTSDKIKLESEIESALGEPSSVLYYIKDGNYYEKKTWEKSSGKIIKTKISTKPFKVKRDYDKELIIAVQSENYEEASLLRDLIKKERAKKKRAEKKG